jgi:hypothetical protein
MKTEWVLCYGAGLFLGFTAIVYWYWSQEPTGTACLVFGAFAWLTLGTYLIFQGRKLGGVRPEDNPDPPPDDGVGAVDFFPASSMWPVGIGLGLVLFTMGLMFGWWWAVIGLGLIVGGVIGFACEAEAERPGDDALGPSSGHPHGYGGAHEGVDQPHS